MKEKTIYKFLLFICLLVRCVIFYKNYISNFYIILLFFIIIWLYYISVSCKINAYFKTKQKLNYFRTKTKGQEWQVPALHLPAREVRFQTIFCWELFYMKLILSGKINECFQAIFWWEACYIKRAKHPPSAGFPSPSGGTAPFGALVGVPLAPIWETAAFGGVEREIKYRKIGASV